jgi:membrane-associated phospholipid phosphatase
MYRGEHHPTDVLASLVFAGLWIPAVYLLIKPNAVAPAQAPAAVPRARWRASEGKQVQASRG